MLNKIQQTDKLFSKKPQVQGPFWPNPATFEWQILVRSNVNVAPFVWLFAALFWLQVSKLNGGPCLDKREPLLVIMHET